MKKEQIEELAEVFGAMETCKLFLAKISKIQSMN